MNVTNNTNGLPYGYVPSGKRRSISVLQLTTILAFIALPATILFPGIARPIPSVSDQSSIQDQLAAAIVPKHLTVHSFTEANIKMHLQESARIVLMAYHKYYSNGNRS